MTAKRDLKRRVRQRQARTGESYVTARRRVLAARVDLESELREAGEAEGAASTEAAGRSAAREGKGTARIEVLDRSADAARAGAVLAGEVPVVELHEWTEQGRALGFRCRITVYPSVVELGLPETVLGTLRDALVRAAGDPDAARMFAVAFGVGAKPSIADLRRRPPAALAFLLFDGTRPVPLVCRLWLMAPTLILRRADDDAVHEVVTGIRDVRGAAQPLVELLPIGRPLPKLFVMYRERRYPITRDPFVIGRDHRVADLAIGDGMVSHEHVAIAVARRNGAYYLYDLGSSNRVTYRGVRIGQKRIEEGDVFQLGAHELRFTFREDD